MRQGCRALTSDIYETYAHHKSLIENDDPYAEYVIRASHDRVLADGRKLWSAVESAPLSGEICFNMPGTSKRSGREVEQTIQIAKVVLKSPYRKHGKLPK